MSTLLLALDTATEAVAWGVARLDGDTLDVLSAGYDLAPRRANTMLLRVALDGLADAGERLADVGGIVVGKGPGSFTGVRIGVATAKGLAQGRGVPLAGVGTLDAIAWQYARGYEGLVAVVGDAMRGEVYPALFRCEGGLARRLGTDRVAAPSDVAREWGAMPKEPIVLVGNGMAKYAELFSAELGDRAIVAPEEAWWPSGVGLFAALAAAGASAALAAGDPGAVLPIYTRLSDAEENERARADGSAGVPASGVAGDAEESGP